MWIKKLLYCYEFEIAALPGAGVVPANAGPGRVDRAHARFLVQESTGGPIDLVLAMTQNAFSGLLALLGELLQGLFLAQSEVLGKPANVFLVHDDSRIRAAVGWAHITVIEDLESFRHGGGIVAAVCQT